LRAHAALGLVAFAIRYDWRTAEAELKRALALDPSFAPARQWESLDLLYTGRMEEALAESRKSLELDPVSLHGLIDDGMVSYYSRRYQEAAGKARKILEMDPGFREAHLMLGMAMEGLQDWGAAEREYHAASLASTGETLRVPRGWRVSMPLSGRASKARQILGRLLHPARDQYVDPYQVAFVLTALGDSDQALEWVERAIRQHTAMTIKVDPYLDPLRGRPEFQRLLTEAHLN